MASDTSQTVDAFIHFFGTFELSRPVKTLADFSDGAALYDLLSEVDSQYFTPSPNLASSGTDEWVDRLNSLKRVYRLMMHYFGDVLRQPTSRLDVPDLNAIAKDYSAKDTLNLCKLALAAAVQSEGKKDVVDRIQKLSAQDQHHLMRAIEQVMSKLSQQNGGRPRADSMTEDDRYYQIQSERSKALIEKETVEKAYETLMKEHQTLQTNFEEASAAKEDALSQVRHARKELDDRRNDRADASMRAEIDRLRTDLQRAEDSLNVSETELERQNAANAILTRQVDELQVRADEAVKLKDSVDEYKHAAEKLQKTENVMEKYKKKLEESADLRRRIKSLEEQNATLVDKNASLEEDYRKVSAYKPLMESYKSQISDLESKAIARNKDMDAVKFELEQAKTRLRIVSEEHQKDTEAIDLYQERVMELELSTAKPPTKRNASKGPGGNMTDMTEAELLGEGSSGLGEELEDALSGTTTTDLKLQIRKLKRDLDAARNNQADASRVMVLENLLEDANRMKSRYEQDYLAAHRETLKLQSNLEEIRSGKTGDSSEAAIALRQLLNEKVEALDLLRKEHNEISVKFESQSKELTIAKSDLNLVNKDQVDILASLRESVSEDKLSLETDLDKLKGRLKDLSDKNRMQLEQINALLIEKVNMQSEGIGHREKMLARERDFSNLRSTLAGKEIPEELKQRLLAMHEDNVLLREQVNLTNEKLTKAKAFIKNQDQLFKAEAAKLTSGAAIHSDENVPASSSQVKAFEAEIQRLETEKTEMLRQHQEQQRLVFSLVHQQGMKTMRGHLGALQQSQPSSWLRQQRVTQVQSLRRS